MLVIGAFGSNRRVLCVEMANAALGEAEGVEWGRALASNSTLTALNLGYNMIGTPGRQALEAAQEAHPGLVSAVGCRM